MLKYRGFFHYCIYLDIFNEKRNKGKSESLPLHIVEWGKWLNLILNEDELFDKFYQLTDLRNTCVLTFYAKN